MPTGFNIVIPARFASSRLPGKPLLDIAGKPMIQHVHERAVESGAETIVIATDDEKIQSACQQFGADCCMTDPDHMSGSDRIAEVLEKYQWPNDTIIVNLQGDEPLMRPELITQVGEDMAAHQTAVMTTLCTPIHTAAELLDPHVVKVVTNRDGYAMYFSRAAIPWDRDAFAIDTEELPENSQHYRHIGLYAYKASFIREYSQLAPCYEEQTESLEQLRVLWHGYQIHVSFTEIPPGHGVDTPQDLERVTGLLASC